jgi:hypothetical protein
MVINEWFTFCWQMYKQFEKQPNIPSKKFGRFEKKAYLCKRLRQNGDNEDSDLGE